MNTSQIRSWPDLWKHRGTATLFALGYWLLAASVFIGAAWSRFQLPSTPIADPDTWGYLSPAMSALLGDGWAHHLRNYLYPGFLFVLLRIFQNFDVITVAQHLAGLGAGVVFLLIWRRLRDFITDPNLPHILHQLLGLFGVMVFLNAKEPIVYESKIRCEGIAPLLVMLNIWFVVEFSYRCWVRRDRTLPLGWALATVASAILLSLAKPSFTIAALGSVVPVLGVLFLRFPNREKATLVLGSLGLVLLLLLPEQIAARGDLDSKFILPTQLFFTHAAIIRDQMRSDLASHRKSPYPDALISRAEQSLDREITKSAEHSSFLSLGFNPDFLMFGRESFDTEMRQQFHQDRRQLGAFYRFYYERAWRGQPRRMLAKIWRQMLVFYAPVCPAYHPSRIWPIADSYAGSLAVLELAHASKNWGSYPPLRIFLAKSSSLAASGKVLRLSSKTRRYEEFLSHSYLWCCLATLGLAVLLSFRQALRPHIWPLAAIVLSLYWYNFGNSFEVAVVHTLDHTRYDRIQLVFTILAQSATLLLLIELGATLIGRLLGHKLSPPQLSDV